MRAVSIPSVRRLLHSSVAAALAVALASCGGDGGGPGNVNTQAFIAGVSLLGGGGTAVFRTGAIPAGSASGPAVTVSGNASVVNGGSLQVPITGSVSFNRVLVGVAGQDGFWEVSIPGTISAARPSLSPGQPLQVTLVLRMGQTLPSNSFQLKYAVATSGGAQGVQVTQAVTATTVTTGEVQVSVSWDAASDVDLHVVEPSGEEIYFGNPVSATNGRLDLDSNAGCSIDNKNNENIAWSSAPTGTYIVRVDYWSSCQVAATNYTVTVNVRGRAAQTFTGSFTGPGDQGGQGSGVTITTFTK